MNFDKPSTMKLVIAVLVTVYITTVLAGKEEWVDFKTQFKRTYHSLKEERFRFNIFEENLNKINAHNIKYANGESTYTMAVNKFADMTVEEYKRLLGQKQSSSVVETVKQNNFDTISLEDIPDAIDWRTEGAVTPVKNQGSCAGCWAFSVSGSVESSYFLATGNLVNLSTQQIIDCDDACYGCNGGWTSKAFVWVAENGLQTEKDYPFEGGDDTCRYKNSSVVAKLSEFVAVTPYDVDALKKAVALIGPVSVAINTDTNFMHYSAGLLDDPLCTADIQNHAVLVIGYNTTDDGKDYWLVKNSWGEDWGEKGYIKMTRGKENQCGILNQPFYGIIEK